jgi:hypothetical protein
VEDVLLVVLGKVWNAPAEADMDELPVPIVAGVDVSTEARGGRAGRF